MDTFYIGSQLKILFEITADGFTQDSSTYTIVLKCGGVTKTDGRSHIVTNNSKHYLLVDTSEFNAGVLTATVTASVTDNDFTSNVRREVEVVELCHLRETP